MENILFIRLRLLGDIIFTIPAIQIYKSHFPKNHIYYLVEEKFKEIAEIIPGIHRVLFIPHKIGLKDIIQFRKKIQSIGFNSVVDFHSGPKSAILTMVSGIKTRIGYKTPNRNWAYNHLTPRKLHDFPTHSTYNQAMLLEHLGIKISEHVKPIPPYPPIVIPEISVSKSLKKAIKKNKTIVIHIGAGNQFRDWGREKFLALIGKLQQKNINVCIIGNTEAEIEKGKYLKSRFPILDFTGKLSIRETLYLITNSDLYLGFDSGPLHLASLTKTPIIALYGPNIPEISGPWRKKDIILVETDLKCRPCSQKKCIYDTIRCINDLSVDYVYEKIKKFIH